MKANTELETQISSLLSKAEPPWIAVDVLSEMRSEMFPEVLYSSSDQSGRVVRKLRGRKMLTQQSLMDEFGAAFQFFDAFGENWHALGECLSYLDEWLPASAYVLVITEPLVVLSEGDRQDLDWLLKVLGEAGEWWSKPIVDNGRFNRPARPFHTILQSSHEELEAVSNRFGKIPILAS